MNKKRDKKPSKPLRILMLNYEFPPLGGGASPVSYEIAKGYVKLGHQVDVITMHYKGLPKFENKDGIKIYRVKCLRTKKEICHPWEQLTYIISAKRFLRQHMKTHQYNINHTHFIIPTGVISLWLKKKYNLPYIITAHGSDVPGYNPDRFKLLHHFTKSKLKEICNEAKYIISPSNYLSNLMKREIGLLDIKVIPNGIDINKFKPGKKRKIILSTGRLLPRKGFQYLIKAASKSDYGYEIHIAGDGPMMNELKRLANSSSTKIVFHGWLDNKSNNYKNLLESASIYCLVSEKENSSIALLEGMSAGCAIITSNVAGCPETIKSTGIVIEPKNSTILNNSIRRLIYSKNLLKKLSKEARNLIENKYNQDDLIKNYESLII